MGSTITLDLNNDSVKHLCNKDKYVAKVISKVGSITFELPDDGYSFCYMK